MLSLFRRNLIPNLILVCVLCIGLNVVFFFKESWNTNVDIFSLLDISGFNLLEISFLKNILAIVLICIQAFYVNDMVIKHKFSRALSSIPAATFILLMAIISFKNLDLNIITANLFCILAVNSLFKVYKKYQPVTTIFNAGLFLGIASLVHPPYMVFLPVWFMCLYSLRNLKIKESLQLIIGYFVGPFFLYLHSFYKGAQDSLLPQEFQYFPDMAWPEDIRIVVIASILLILLLTLVVYSNDLKKKKKFDAIKKIEFMYWMLFFSVISLIFKQSGNLIHLTMTSLPLSILLGMMLENKQNQMFKEMVFIILLGLIVFFQFGFDYIS